MAGKLTQTPSQHLTDCGIVALSTITGLSYNKTLKTVLPNRRKYADYGVSINDLLNFCSKHKLRIKGKTSPIIKNLKHHSLIIIEVPLHNKKSDLHAVVWDAESKKILDAGGWGKTIKYYQKRALISFEFLSRLK